jgi:hypothetical protein
MDTNTKQYESDLRYLASENILRINTENFDSKVYVDMKPAALYAKQIKTAKKNREYSTFSFEELHEALKHIDHFCEFGHNQEPLTKRLQVYLPKVRDFWWSHRHNMKNVTIIKEGDRFLFMTDHGSLISKDRMNKLCFEQTIILKSRANDLFK